MQVPVLSKYSTQGVPVMLSMDTNMDHLQMSDMLIRICTHTDVIPVTHTGYLYPCYSLVLSARNDLHPTKRPASAKSLSIPGFLSQTVLLIWWLWFNCTVDYVIINGGLCFALLTPSSSLWCFLVCVA